jgi:hypothetical protein
MLKAVTEEKTLIRDITDGNMRGIQVGPKA